jgi:hypothetical protein
MRRRAHTVEKLASCAKLVLRAMSSACYEMEDRGRFGRRAAGHPIEATLLVVAELTGALRHVEHDRRGRPIELVLEVRPPWGHLLEYLIAEVEYFEGALIDVETLVVESLPEELPSQARKRR